VIEPEQVADTVAFLASDRASHLSGTVVNLG
jgi:NAD(P)-dependent dehydrogenase (short-subunit alcohol dehydrogenase family)